MMAGAASKSAKTSFSLPLAALARKMADGARKMQERGEAKIMEEKTDRAIAASIKQAENLVKTAEQIAALS